MNGKVSGTINGVTFSDADLHSYIVTAEGRAYTAISRVPVEIDRHLQTVYQVAGIIGWVFAMPQSPARNGLSLSGMWIVDVLSKGWFNIFNIFTRVQRVLVFMIPLPPKSVH